MSQVNKRQNNTPKKYKKIHPVVFIISALVVIIIVAVLINNNWAGKSTAGKTGDPIAKNSDLTIQVSQLSETVQFFPIEMNGTKLEVLAVKAPDGSIRTAFNTCQVCYGSGKGYYVQVGSVLVCQNCGNRFRRDQVEVTKGGCNPVPITSENKTVSDTSITISKEYLSEARSIFMNWKR